MCDPYVSNLYTSCPSTLSMLPTAPSSEIVIASSSIVQGNGPARTLFCPCFHLEMTIYMNIKPIRL